MNRIKDKIKEIETFLDQLKSIVPDSLEIYKADLKEKLACERLVQKIIEALLDLAFLTIKTKKLELPEDDLDAFALLEGSNILDKNISQKLKDAKGMRNIIIHQYGRIDDELIFNAANEELAEDAEAMITQIQEALK